MGKTFHTRFTRDDLRNYTMFMDRVAVGRTYMDMPSYNISRYDKHLHDLLRLLLDEIKRLKEVPRGAKRT